MHEPDVTLTDYALTLECGVFVYRLATRGRVGHPLHAWFIVFFASVGLAACAGGTLHGFVPDAASGAHRALWTITLLAIGLTGLAGWAIGARMYFSLRTARRITHTAGLALVAYAGVVSFASSDFRVAIAYYLPATLFLLIVYGLVYRRTGARAVLTGLLGLLLTVVAAGVQQAGWNLPVFSLSANALYHLLQALALFLIYRSARWYLVPAR